MKRLIILIGRLGKYVAPTKYLFKVPQVGRFMALVGVIRRCVESPLNTAVHWFRTLRTMKRIGCMDLRRYYTLNLEQRVKLTCISSLTD